MTLQPAQILAVDVDAIEAEGCVLRFSHLKRGETAIGVRTENGSVELQFEGERDTEAIATLLCNILEIEGVNQVLLDDEGMTIFFDETSRDPGDILDESLSTLQHLTRKEVLVNLY